jgi:preprotein translocase subunit SecG
MCLREVYYAQYRRCWQKGLFHGAEQFLGRVTGYYTIFHVLLLLALMALCRIKTTEKLRGHQAQSNHASR